MDTHAHDLVRIRLQTLFVQAMYVFRCDALNFEANHFICIDVKTGSTHIADVLRCHSLHLHADNLVGVGLNSQFL